MCGIFGFVAKDDDCQMNMGVIQRLAKITESRGRHAWGLAWVDSQNRIRMYKQTGKISDSLGVLAMARDAKMLIAHCRYATHGDPENNLNNHPHPIDGGWLVHNGVIRDYHRLLFEHGLMPNTECDSEVIGLLYEDQTGSPLARSAKVLALTKGKSPMTWMALWRDRMIVARANGQPLSMGETSKGYYLASLADGLPGKVKEFGDDSVISFDDLIDEAAKN